MRQAWLRTKGFFWTAAALFAFGIAAGIMMRVYAPAEAGRVLDQLVRQFAPLVKGFRAAKPAGRILLIFANNLRTALGMLVLGPTFIMPALAMIVNGLPIGLLGAGLQPAAGQTMLRFLLSILPHGIFELPALFLSAALGWRLGLAAWERLLRNREWFPHTRRPPFGDDLRRLGLLTAGLLLAAACIEALVTPLLAGVI